MLRPWVAVALALLWLPLLPVQAQAGPEPVALAAVDDPAGDTAGPVPAAGAGFVDLTHAEVAFGNQALDFRATVASLQSDGLGLGGWEIWLAFEYRNTRFDLVLEPTSTTVDRPAEVDRILFGNLDAELLRIADDAFLGAFPSFVDLGTRTFNASVPFSAILEPGGNFPMPGEPVRLLGAGSGWNPLLLGTPHNPAPISDLEAFMTGDSAPWPDGTFLAVPGALGDLSLTTAMPVRFSNGEATTMHWPIEVTNQGDRAIDAQLTLDADGAEGRTPPGLHLGPRESKVINVYVTLPFNHAHGSTRSFLLKADSGQGDVASLKLGVDYPTIAQPAGHHPTLWLHAAQEHIAGVPFLGWHWMNTAEDDERQNEQLAGARFTSCPGSPQNGLGGSLEWGTLWMFGMDPGLRMGLDGRVGELAVLDATLVGQAAVPSGKVYGRLLRGTEVGDDRAWFSDPAVSASAPVAASPGPSSVPIHLEIPLPPELDYVPPAVGEDLVLAVLHCVDAPAPTGMALATAVSFATIAGARPLALAAGGRLVVPLDEYHDIVDTGGSAAGLTLQVPDAIRRAAPGSTVLWTPHLTFPEGDSGRYAVRLFGTGAANARLLGPAAVDADGPVDLPVALEVPDVRAGDVIDLLVDVTNLADPGRSVALRLSVVVDPTQTGDDALALDSLHEAKESPGPGALFLLGLLVLLAGRRRRQ